MAIKPDVRYPGKINAADSEYPLGSAKDIVTPGDGTGTPWEKNLVNDIWGFLQKLLAKGGITANNVPDTVLASQYYQSLIKIMGNTTDYVFLSETAMLNGITILNEEVIFADKQVLKIQASGLPVRFFVVTTSVTSLVLGGGLYAEEVTAVGSVSGTTGMKITTTYIASEATGTCRYEKTGGLVTLRIPQMSGTSSVSNLKISPQTSWPADILPVASTGSFDVRMPCNIINGSFSVPGTIQLPDVVSADLEIMVADAAAVYKTTGFSGTVGIQDQFITYHVN